MSPETCKHRRLRIALASLLAYLALITGRRRPPAGDP